jgi:hypothetical protein
MEINDLYMERSTIYELRFLPGFQMGNIEIYINRTRVKWFVALFLFLFCVECYAIAVYPKFFAEGVFGLFLFGCGLAYLLFLLTLKGPSVVLSQGGITSRNWRGQVVHWDAISFVEVRGTRRNKYVRIHFENGGTGKRSFMIATKTLMISPYELCELLQLLASVKAEKRQEIIDGILAGVDLSVINIR